VFSANPPGLIAFVGKRAAGWCAVRPRAEYPQYEGGSDEGVWAIPCLSLDEAVRGSRVARVLIEAAIEYATARGASVIEGPPPY